MHFAASSAAIQTCPSPAGPAGPAQPCLGEIDPSAIPAQWISQRQCASASQVGQRCESARRPDRRPRRLAEPRRRGRAGCDASARVLGLGALSGTCPSVAVCVPAAPVRTLVVSPMVASTLAGPAQAASARTCVSVISRTQRTDGRPDRQPRVSATDAAGLRSRGRLSGACAGRSPLLSVVFRGHSLLPTPSASH